MLLDTEPVTHDDSEYEQHDESPAFSHPEPPVDPVPDDRSDFDVHAALTPDEVCAITFSNLLIRLFRLFRLFYSCSWDTLGRCLVCSYICSLKPWKCKPHTNALDTSLCTTVWCWDTHNTKEYSVSTVTHLRTKSSTTGTEWTLSS